MPIDTVLELKRNLLKQYLLTKYPEGSGRTLIMNATQGFWRILVSNPNCLEWYNELEKAGISPTLEELAEYLNWNINAWQAMSLTDNGIRLFQALLNKGIVPQTAELNLCNTYDNSNVWYCLSSSDDGMGMPIFQALLDKGIAPQAADLAICNSKHNTNAWYWLASSDSRIPIFQALLDKGIVPQAADLAICNSQDNTNAWYWLASSNVRIPIFQALLAKGIIPQAADLGICNSADNTNTWYWLASSDSCVPIFQALLAKGIVPQAADLNITDNEDDTNAWRWLATSDARIQIFQVLLDNGIVPQAAYLSIRSSKDNTNAWDWLISNPSSSDENCSVLFQALLAKGIVPQAADLSVYNRMVLSTNWDWLARSDFRIPIFQALLDKGITPQAADLGICNSEDNTNTWYWLTNSGTRVSIFQALLAKNIVPKAVDLDLNVSESMDITNAWDGLARINSAEKLLVQLYDFGIIPKEKIIVPEKINKKLRTIIDKLNNTCESLNKITCELKIDENNPFALLLARDNDEIKRIYGFLYLFLAVLRTEDNPLPLEIWYQISSYLLPSFVDWKVFNTLIENSNRTAFVKSHVKNSLDKYINSFSFFSLSSLPTRAESLKKAIMNSENPHKLLSEQYCMSKNPKKTPYRDVAEEHQKPFETKNTDNDFLTILKEGIRMC